MLTVSQGMIEWPRPTLPELWRLVVRSLRTRFRGRRLARDLRVAKPTGQ